MKEKIFAATVAVLFFWAGAAISAPAQTEKIQTQKMRVEVLQDPLGIRILDSAGKILLETNGGVSFTTVRGQKSPFGKGQEDPWTDASKVAGLKNENGKISVDLASNSSPTAVARLKLFFINENALRVEGEILNRPEVNRFIIKFKSGPDEKYFGMGERFNSAQQRGNRVYNWTEEGCVIGCNNTEKTYFPVPFFLNPAGYGFLLDDTHYSVFDFAKAKPDILEITNWNNKFNFIIFYGPKPLQVIENMTAYTGRVKVPPEWAFAPWVSATARKLQGTKDGPAHVRKVMNDCRQNQIPASAVWSEDWAWASPILMIYSETIQWQLNRQRYRDYEQLAKDLHEQGFRFLSYFAPYLGVLTKSFKQGAEKGYLAKDPDGKAAVFRWVLPRVGEPDLTNPEAREWWQKNFFQKSVDLGADGWMHDFSEYTPAGAKFSDGRDGWAVHNDYPRLWDMTAREFFEKARPDNDFVFFIRAGYTGSWKYAPVMWTGDQNMSWEKFDGIPSVIPAINSVGISGFPIGSTDIAGYMCVASSATDKELFFRWTQLGALHPVMRTHESSGCTNNWLFNSDRDTLMHFKKYAVLHTSLFPYFYTLAQQAQDHGWPIVRHLVLQYPDDPGSAAQEYEFMLGDRILVAPVLKEGAREWEVYFPPGKWVDFWSGKKFEGPGKFKAPAPLEQIPIFVKNGTMIPIFDSQIDTLVKIKKPGIKGFDDANSSIKVLFFGDGDDDYTIWDNTRFQCSSTSKTCTVSGAPVKRNYSYEFK